MIKRSFYILTIIFIISSIFGEIKLYREEEPVKPFRVFGFGYAHRFVYIDADIWNSRKGSNYMAGDDELPEISAPLRLNGISFFGKLSPNSMMGLKVFGGSSSAENSYGNSDFWTAMGGFFVEARKGRIVLDWYGSVGTSISVGRCAWTSNYKNGAGISGHTDALYIEPTVGIGYDFDGVVEIKAYWSYIYAKFTSSTWTAPDDVDYDAIPEGHGISLLIRYFLPV